MSGEHIVFFDPHAESLPGATPSNPGLKIKFAGAGYLEQVRRAAIRQPRFHSPRLALTPRVLASRV